MPIIDHNVQPIPEVLDRRRERALISKEEGATSLTVTELELHPGWEDRLHTHPFDVAMMVIAGAVQMVVGDEVRTVRAWNTLLAPPGVPHKLVNKLWIPVKLLVIYPAPALEASYLE